MTKFRWDFFAFDDLGLEFSLAGLSLGMETVQIARWTGHSCLAGIWITNRAFAQSCFVNSSLHFYESARTFFWKNPIY